MTNVAAAATSTVTDPSMAALLSKTSSQGGDAGAFARALTDANEDNNSNPAQLDGQETNPSADSTPAARFNALNNLASLGSQLQMTGTAGTDTSAAQQAAEQASTDAPQPPSQPATNTAQTLLQAIAPQGAQQQPPADMAQTAAQQSAAAQALLQAAAQQGALPADDGQVPPRATGAKTDLSADEISAALVSAGQEELAAGLDLTKFTAAVTGVKRPSSALAEGSKGKAADEAASPDDVAGSGQADAPAPAANAQLAPSSASAEALLQLMVNSATGAKGDPSALNATDGTIADGPAKIDAAVSLDDSDTSMDFLAPTGGETDAPDTKSFRFQKVGDAAVAISLSITKGDGGGAELQESVGDIEKPEMITVLDSRRYLGFGMGSNASNLLSAASNDRDWASAMYPASSLSNAASVSSTGNVVNTLKLQLSPEHLGTVTANMRLQGEELSIHLTVHNAAAYRELSNDSKPMLEALRAQGFNVDQVTVSLASSADPNSNSSSGQPQANNNPQAQHQQPQRDGEAARQQAQGRSSGQPGGNETENRNETAVEASVRSNGNAGSVYL
ncbi:flagellar hook-length control protein FliK [Neorhizobium lilium]|uniref:Flagellar hook-length control protein FliK n=1 Tax=Neorhizobium lilium TaxID=2503024 RepID=A0A3S3SCP5_9HYPH|nr:flagellar hook-length control protein FliK [Neorhizobium lilium]RWX77020.1 flagellar hook-length control protein FliK [Neorhizobium lilium]